MSKSGFQVKAYQNGSQIIKEGELADGLFLIRKGRVEIFRQQNGKEIILGTAAHGQFLGEMSILLNAPCSASARALEEVEVAVFPRNLCEAQFAQAPNWLVSLARGLANRLDLTNRKFVVHKEHMGASELVTDAVDMDWEGSN